MKTLKYINPLRNREGSICLYACGCGRAESGFCRGPCIRNEYVIHYITDGVGYYETGGRKYTVTAGDVFVIFPNEVIKYYTDEDKPKTGYWFDFVGYRGSEYMKEVGISHDCLVIHNVSTLLGKTMQKCFDKMSEGKYSRLYLESCMLECFSYMEEANSFPNANTSPRQKCIQNAIAYMEYAYREKIGVSDIAEYLGFERSYFYRLFKEEMSISPSEYLTGLRINRAKELLGAGETVKVTAYSVGIDDIYYFSKLFTRETGVSPSTFKKEHGRMAEDNQTQ